MFRIRPPDQIKPKDSRKCSAFAQLPKIVCSLTRKKKTISNKDTSIQVETTNTSRGEGFFFEHVFSPEELFNRVIHELRNGLLSHKRSGNCYVYYIHFPFDIGFFPYQSHGPSFTDIAKVVCRFTVCQYCFKHCPGKVVSIYPWMPKGN